MVIKHGNESNQSQWIFHWKFYGTRGFTLVSQVLCPYVYQFHPPKLRLITPNEQVVVANILAWPWPKMRLESTKGGFWPFIHFAKQNRIPFNSAGHACLPPYKTKHALMSSIPSIKFQWYLIYPSKSRQINYSWYQRAFIHNWTSNGDKTTSNHLPPNENVTGPLSSRTWSSLSFESCCGSLPLERNEQLRSFLRGIYDSLNFVSQIEKCCLCIGFPSHLVIQRCLPLCRAEANNSCTWKLVHCHCHDWYGNNQHVISLSHFQHHVLDHLTESIVQTGCNTT